jgi:hypothetical protein
MMSRLLIKKKKKKRKKKRRKDMFSSFLIFISSISYVFLKKIPFSPTSCSGKGRTPAPCPSLRRYSNERHPLAANSSVLLTKSFCSPTKYSNAPQISREMSHQFMKPSSSPPPPFPLLSSLVSLSGYIGLRL